jgi:hypothetical protein
MNPLPYQYDDGGRSLSGLSGTAGDCVVRAIAIATGLPYRKVYDDLHAEMRARGPLMAGKSPRSGVPMDVVRAYMARVGWEWVPTMRVGTGCTVHLTSGEIPDGRVVARVSKHMVAVVNGVMRDTFDPSRGGTRCVYGFFRREAS